MTTSKDNNTPVNFEWEKPDPVAHAVKFSASQGDGGAPPPANGQDEPAAPSPSPSPYAQLVWTIPLAIVIAGVLISASIIYSNALDERSSVAQLQQAPGNGQQAPDTKVAVSEDNDPVLGSPDAPVTIIEFSDYQCPFCRSFWSNALQEIKKQYIDTGKAKLIYRDYPLSFHPMAQPSALAAECAKDQGKYWEMHDKMFEEQAKRGTATVQYTELDLKQWAYDIGLDTAEFNSCFDSQKYKEEVQNDFNDGAAAGVTGTPTIFINGRKIVGALPFAAFQEIIESELNQ